MHVECESCLTVATQVCIEPLNRLMVRLIAALSSSPLRSKFPLIECMRWSLSGSSSETRIRTGAWRVKSD